MALQKFGPGEKMQSSSELTVPLSIYWDVQMFSRFWHRI